MCTINSVWAKDTDKNYVWKDLQLYALRLFFVCLNRGIKVKYASANHFRGTAVIESASVGEVHYPKASVLVVSVDPSNA